MKWMSTPSISVVNCGSAFSRLDPAEFVVGRPVASEGLNRCQLHALRPIVDELFGGQARRLDAAAQVFQCLFRNVGVERTDLGCGFDTCHTHLPVVGSTLNRRGPSHYGDARRSFVEAVALRRRGERSK
jgi:hypothetical protein